MEDLRQHFLRSFVWIFVAGFALIVLYAMATLWVGLRISDRNNGLTGELVPLRILQMALGMMVGFFTLFLGVLVGWLGIEAKYRVSGHFGGSSVMVASASPGILLIVSGTIPLLTALLRPVDGASETTIERRPAAASSASSSSPSAAVSPSTTPNP